MTPPQMNSFLGCPIELRWKIYHEAGLIRGRCIPIVSRKYQTSERRWPLSSVPGMTHNLLQVSKHVKHEVGVLICAHNTLALVQEEIEYGLAFLRGLSPYQCAALKSLSIQLYHIKKAWWQKRPASPPGPSWEPIPIGSWLSTARHVLSNTYQTLAVQLFCHTGAKSITTAILQPFLEFPGHLKDLELELDCEKGASHFELRTLAWQTVCCAKGTDTSHPFPFFALPAEIRHQILTYTDLVTPLGEIYWNTRQGFKILRIVSNCYVPEYCEAEVRLRGSHQACRFFSCAGNNSLATGFKCCESRQNWGPRCSKTGFVCCRSRTGYSSRCRCWSDPKSLLVANRELYHEAIRVLYSCNRVIIVPSGDFRIAIGPIKERLDAAVFITRHMWPQVLHYLRDLECVFPCINPSSPNLAHDPYILDLCFAIDHLALYACMSGLHVSVYLTTAGSVRWGDTGWFHWELKRHDAATAVRAHSQFLSAFRSMKGIKDFFVNLEWAWHYYSEEPGSRDDEGLTGVLFDEIDMLDISLERMIMGDGYTPGLVRKSSRKLSVWPSTIYMHLEHSSWSECLSHPDAGYI
ncbi:hypothetical protein F5Y10DRAFT_251022 [Nemania abortiva]|nr:hypothetical protein F5Y10DRAFT_251022 [Nemania abortiva]